MRKIVLIFAISLLFGCAAPNPRIDNILKFGDFAVAYKYAIVRGEMLDRKSQFVSNLKSHPSGFSSDKFYQSALSDILSGRKRETDFIEFARLIKLALSDGLITDIQARLLSLELLYAIESEAISSPHILKSHSLQLFFPDVNSSQAKFDSLNYKFDNLSKEQDVKLSELFLLLTISSDFGDDVLTKRVRDLSYKIGAMKVDTLLLASSKFKISYSDFLPLVQFANFYNDQEFSGRIRRLLQNVNYSKHDLNSKEMIAFDPVFVQNELAARLVKYRLSIEPSDGAFYEDFSKILLEKNEWIEFDDESKSILLVKKQRFLEHFGTPSIGTEIVPDPNFSTILYIPKNASVLFDYVTTEYRIDYSIDVSVLPSGKKKIIRGSDNLKKVDCRNVRFQNVFGGVGSVDWYPNDRVQNFCTSTSGLSFDDLRKRVIEKIASDVNNAILVK